MKLNLGCGSQVPEGWTNVDYALGARFAKIPLFLLLNRKLRLFNLDWNKNIYLHDLTKTFPWADCSTDVVYTSHTLEHFSKEAGRRFLKECYRVLRKNGIIRIVVPDLRYLVVEYLEGRSRADEFVASLGVLYASSDSGLKNRLSPFIQFPHIHKCMYDSSTLLEILKETGFDASSRAAFDSDIDDIRSVEAEGRTENAVIVEGRKQ
ncbi:MAG TPA: methyltransferase domain-containing protein [Burkholderiales bacterium]|nr:methyltransferase domain-containing protein [Burkholderiales bacterium]